MNTMEETMTRQTGTESVAFAHSGPRAFRQREMDLTDIGERLDRLTGRQQDVLKRVIKGEPNKVIAMDLAISQRTVEKHREGIMRKLGVRSVAMLVRMIVLYQAYSGAQD